MDRRPWLSGLRGEWRPGFGDYLKGVREGRLCLSGDEGIICEVAQRPVGGLRADNGLSAILISPIGARMGDTLLLDRLDTLIHPY